MKKNKIIFWTTTGIISVMMLFAAYNYLTNPDMEKAFIHLGFPQYFRIELAAAKILGVLALLLPIIPTSLKQFAYFGFAITFVSAFIAHASSGDPMNLVVMPLVFFALLVISYAYFQKTIVIRN